MKIGQEVPIPDTSYTVGTGGTGSMQGSVVKVFQVYGRIPAGQYVPAGSYSDAVSVNLLY